MIEMTPEIVTILMFAGIVAGVLFLGHPIAFVLGGLAAIFGFLGWGYESWHMFASRAYDSATNNILIAVPNFILMAAILERAGISERLFTAMLYLFGPLNGAIALAVIIMCAIQAACTGVIGAAVVSMTILAMPIMLRHGYEKPLSCGAIASGGTLSILIPPSIMLVMMADQGGVSVGKLFAGAFLPGLFLTGIFFAYILVVTFVSPQKGPALPLEERKAISVGEKTKFILINMLPPIFLILGVLGFIWAGVATPTEASAVGALFAFILMILYGKFSWRMLGECIWITARVNCMVMAIIISASIFTGVFVGLGGGGVVKELIMSFAFLGKWGIIGMMMFIVFIMGFLIDYIAIIYITFPIFLPIAQEMGIDLIWLITLIAINLQSSFLTPPVGYALFYMQGSVPPEVKLTDIYKGVLPFIVLQVIGLIVCLLFPKIITFLPSIILD